DRRDLMALITFYGVEDHDASPTLSCSRRSISSKSSSGGTSGSSSFASSQATRNAKRRISSRTMYVGHCPDSDNSTGSPEELSLTTECHRRNWCRPPGRTARPPRSTAGRRSCSRCRTGTAERKIHPRTPRSTGRRTSSNCRSPASCRSSSPLPLSAKLGFPTGQQLPESVGVQFRDPLGDGLDRPSRDAAHVGQRRRLTGSALLLPVVHLLHQLAVAKELDAFLLVRQQGRRRFVVGRQRRGVRVGGRRPLRGGRRGRGGRSGFAGVQPRPDLLAEFGAGLVQHGIGEERRPAFAD